MPEYNFDQPVERRGTGSIKWGAYPADVLPLWVADMDFAGPPELVEAIQRRAAHGIFGYQMDLPALREVFTARLKRLYNWDVKPEEIVFVPGVVTGLNLAARVVGKPGDAIIMNTPVYGPFLTVPTNQGRFAQMVDMDLVDTGSQTFTYEINFDAFEAAITPQTTHYFLCSPHNPAGRTFSREELTRLAEICARRDIIITSDEIHCDLLLDDAQHIPLAALSPEISQRTITLMAPSKTFNMPGLSCSMAIIQNETLRKAYATATWGAGLHVNLLGLEAALAAYEHGDAWLKAVLAYIQDNRDVLAQFVFANLPNVRTTIPEATYLAWLDWRGVNLPEGMTPADFCLKEAKVALNAGDFFGPAGRGFLRMNLGTQRATLMQALERIQQAYSNLG